LLAAAVQEILMAVAVLVDLEHLLAQVAVAQVQSPQ
jgi:hypothetical protein